MNPLKASQSVQDSSAMLDYLISGKALPDHLARSRAGIILPKSRTQAETSADEQRRFNAAVAANIAAKLDKAPLIAVNYNHTCKCGNVWSSFGFYARKVKSAIHLEAEATFTKRLSYNPAPERPTEIIVNEVKETACLKCYMSPVADTPIAPVPTVTRFSVGDKVRPIAPGSSEILDGTLSITIGTIVEVTDGGARGTCYRVLLENDTIPILFNEDELAEATGRCSLGVKA